MDLALPPMPFSAVHVPASGQMTLQIPVDMRNSGIGGANSIIGLPAGVVQVIVTWKGVEPITIRHYVGNTSTYETIATIPASTTVKDRSTGVMTLASDKPHGIQLVNGNGTNWNANTLSKGYVVGVQVMPMGTAADITGGGSLLRVDNSVGTRVFLGDQMIYGDTGWRNISTLITNLDVAAASYQSARIKRTGDLVRLRLIGRTIETLGPLLNPIPGGFVPALPAYNVIGLLPQYGAENRIYRLSNLSTNTRVDLQVAVGAHAAGATIGGEISWTTSHAWPTSLPGTA